MQSTVVKSIADGEDLSPFALAQEPIFREGFAQSTNPLDKTRWEIALTNMKAGHEAIGKMFGRIDVFMPAGFGEGFVAHPGVTDVTQRYPNGAPIIEYILTLEGVPRIDMSIDITGRVRMTMPNSGRPYVEVGNAIKNPAAVASNVRTWLEPFLYREAPEPNADTRHGFFAGAVSVAMNKMRAVLGRG